MLPTIEERLAKELSALPKQIIAAMNLLDEGATVPFIARYRKEVTGGLDDVQLRTLEQRLGYLRELEARRQTIIESITEQNKMTPSLMTAILKAEDKVSLEDIYLPYKLKRRTKAQIAIEAGLLPLADTLLADPSQVPEHVASAYIQPAFQTEKGDNPGVPDVKAALEGARYILMERFAEAAPLLQECRQYLQKHGIVKATILPAKEEEGVKYRDYFDYAEPFMAVASHRALAIFRGRREGILSVALKLESEEEKPKWDAPFNPCEGYIARFFNISNQQRPADTWLCDTVCWAWRVKILTHLENELFTQLREKAEKEAIAVFAQNLKALLLASPAGSYVTMGLDPGLRTGVKVAIVDTTGKVLEDTTIYPHAPHHQWDKSIDILAALAKKHTVSLVAIGNGTASRETDALAQALIAAYPACGIRKMVVSEAGASVYSASELASKELPHLDVSLRGAVSIARRLQDPLAELVKIDPKSIGVGQYQHDVNQIQLAKSLDAVVEDCVNAVGVDVNTASAALLSRVSGLNTSIAQHIVHFRDAQGRFTSRTQLRSVPRLGDKTFEQAAGFLRIMDGESPLDASAVHPESYPLVEKILAHVKRDVKEVIGDTTLLRKLKPEDYVDTEFGLPTITDILKELEKPGRDPRPAFVTATFKAGVTSIKDVKPEMILEGVVTNVAAFGAFVDVGVHQDGLVHISALSKEFVSDPHRVVKVGQVVKVKVLGVDTVRNRIELSMRLTDEANRGEMRIPKEHASKKVMQSNKSQHQSADTAMAAAFAKLRTHVDS